MLRWKSASLALALGALSCGSEDSISLSARVQNVQINVVQKTLGTQLTGTFELFLEVGPEADGASTVSLETFALLRAADQATLVAPLDALPEGVTFPVQVGKGQQKIVPFALNENDILPAGDKDAICAGAVQVKGAVTDTLSGGGTNPLSSKPVLAGGC